jgi:putative transposase
LPWRVTSPVKERERLIRAHQTGKHTVSDLAEAFGVSRKTVHKWLKRFIAGGMPGLEDSSRAPRHHPNAVSPEVTAAVIRAKQAHPSWGPLKLQPGPEEPSEVVRAWPAPSTRGLILARAGLTRSRRRKRRVPPGNLPFGACDEPNAVWCADFKGWFRTQDGQRCDPLTISDAYSRMLLCCRVVQKPDYAHVRPVFENVFREYGLPLAIRTDNGPPFASTAAGGLSRLSAWWVKLGIRLERIRAGHPEQNGRHERMHLTLKQECCQPPALTPAAQQLCFDIFQFSYNTERPHQALGLVSPAAWYRYSPRPYPDRLEDPEYPPEALVRRVRSNGEIRWRGNLVFLSEALIGEAVGLIETLTGFDVYFGPILLGHLNPGQERLIRPNGGTSQRASVTHVLG